MLFCSKEWRRSKWAFPYKRNHRRRKREGGGPVWTLGTGVKCPRLQVGPLPLRGSCICTTRGSSPPLQASGDLNTILILVINIIHIIHLLDGSNSKLYGGRNPSFWGHPQVVWLSHRSSLGFYLSLMPHLKITLDITNLFRWQEWVTKSIAAGLANFYLRVYLLFSELRSFLFLWWTYAHVLLNKFVVYQWPARYPLSLQKFEKMVMLFFVLLSINIVLNIIVISKRNMIVSLLNNIITINTPLCAVARIIFLFSPFVWVESLVGPVDPYLILWR